VEHLSEEGLERVFVFEQFLLLGVEIEKGGGELCVCTFWLGKDAEVGKKRKLTVDGGTARAEGFLLLFGEGVVLVPVFGGGEIGAEDAVSG